MIVPEDKYEDLEAEADRLIFAETSANPSHADKSDVLTPWKQYDRWRHEVYVGSGVALPEVRQGTYGKAYNAVQPHLNSREGVAGLSPRAGKPTPLGHYLMELGVNPSAPGVGRTTCTGHHKNETCSHSCPDSRSWR